MTTYLLGHGNVVDFPEASFNHATGFIYRAQGYGQATQSVFDIQEDLRRGSAFEGDYWAIKNVPITYEQAVTYVNPTWRRCPFCTGFHPKGSEC